MKEKQAPMRRSSENLRIGQSTERGRISEINGYVFQRKKL